MRLKFWIVSFTLLPLSFLTACNPNSQLANENGSASCEVSGESFGIVGGKTLSSGNELSATTVSILYSTQEKKNPSVCTGTLIAADKVLTAAHCVGPDEGQILVGFSNDLPCSYLAKDKKAFRKVVSHVVHTSYVYGGNNFTNAPYDLAVLKFEGTLPEGFKFRELPSRTYEINKADTIVVAGYGKTDDDKNDTGTLRFTTAAGTRLSTRFFMDSYGYDVNLKNTHVLEQPENGICQGDSGGPLYSYDNNKLTLIGISSLVVDNKTPLHNLRKRYCHGVSVFSDIRDQLPWITTQMNTL